MATSAPLVQNPALWYQEAGLIEKFYCGVFEGGGAKGIAYVGALKAMRAERCWFDQVAGASAGAITAGLIAAGLTPDQIDSATTDALNSVRNGVWSGISNLRHNTGYFRGDDLEKWLDGQFWNQEKILSPAPTVDPDDDPEPDKEPVPNGRRLTFRKLYKLTGIELHVVAADISLGRQMIFSHLDTPHCAVAAAIAASSALPFAFESRLLQVPDGKNVYHHTVLDGGVWSNFPMFLFEDEAFRTYYEREPRILDPDRIMGFLLHERDAEPPARGPRIKIVKVLASDIRAREWKPQQIEALLANDEKSDLNGIGHTRGRRWNRELAAGIVYPLALFGRIVEGAGERGRWPKPKSRLAENLVHVFNGLLGGIHAPLIAVLFFATIAIGTYNIIGVTTEELFISIHNAQWRNFNSLGDIIMGVLLNVFTISLATLVVASSGLAIYANRQLIRASRRILYGLLNTYVTGSGAPGWVICKRNVVALPIPRTVGTLSFDLPKEVREHVIGLAYAATMNKLRPRVSVGSSDVYSPSTDFARDSKV